MEMPDPRTVKPEIYEDYLSKPQISVAFADVTMSFSLKEWLNLEEGEKALYKKVITEIHETMSLKGYIIANPEIVFRIKAEEQQLGLNDSLDLNEKRCTPSKPSISLKVQKVCESYCRNQEQPEQEEHLSAGNPAQSNSIFRPSLSLWVKEMENPCASDGHGKERPSISTQRTQAGAVAAVGTLDAIGWNKSCPDRVKTAAVKTEVQILPEGRTLTAETGAVYGATSAKQWKYLEFSDRMTKENALAFDADWSQPRRTEANPATDRVEAFPDCGKVLGIVSAPVVPSTAIQEGRPFRCKLCDKSFDRKSNLIIHERTHTGEKPFKCPQCERCFSDKSNLNQHQTTHTGERPFQCTFCEKRFSHKVSRNFHQRIHTGERPYRCNLCGKCFRRNSNLNQHLKTHSGDKCWCRKQRQKKDTHDSWHLSQELFQGASLDIMNVTLDIPPVELGEAVGRLHQAALWQKDDYL
ncbi:zinc finger protein 793-like isoform X2 [Ambystoma mexicanum]|uniref:zinc finger protein 793-like isoform X2 n=1 Tax=Ambystoma mexicanum TaxID=8296 RepID=UPI0037E97EE1